MELYLKHYGVKGMKWGVRHDKRPTGKRRPRKNPNDIRLKKGHKIYRIANAGETLDSKRKYVTISGKDSLVYTGELLGGLPYDPRKEVGQYTYESMKDITIKNGKDIVLDLMDKYGGQTLRKDLDIELEVRNKFKDSDERRSFRDEWFTFDDDDIVDLGMQYESSHDKLKDFVWDVVEKNEDTILKDYKRQGYDAIIDPYDYIADIADQPVIILDPKSSLKKKDYYKIWT